ncbi:MAG: DUF2135 domain-containing protein, partial [Bacteroidota bacterium]
PPGSETVTNLRGTGSLYGDTEPLYIVDGVRVSREEFQNMTPNNIKAVNVLKDAAATAIYGNRGANGVVVITTKYYQPDTTSVNYAEFKEDEDDPKEWDANELYLKKLAKTSKNERYAAYLQLREEYGDTPSFYWVVGKFFVEQDMEAEGVRVLSTIADLNLANHELLKSVAYQFQALGRWEESIFLFQTIRKLRELDPHSRRDLALAYQDAGRYQKSLNMFMEVLHDFEDEDYLFPAFRSTVLYEMNNLIVLHRRKLDLRGVPKAWIKKMPVDIRIVSDWNSLGTDLDLWITEPTGEKCGYNNYLTKIGGLFVEDYMDGYGPEEYLLKKAKKGTYQIEVDFYDDRVQKVSGPPTLRVEVFTNYHTKRQKRTRYILRLTAEDEYQVVGKAEW